MYHLLINWTVFWILIIPLVLFICIIKLTKHYWKNEPGKPISIEFFKVPTSNTIIIIGILVPVLIAILSYLFTKNPSGSYKFLISSIILMFCTLILAVWQSFSILKIATNTNEINLSIPSDLHYIHIMGNMYMLLILSLVYLAIFSLYELQIPIKQQGSITTIISDYYIKKPKLNINKKQDEVKKLWGTPSNEDKNKNVLNYESQNSNIDLYFDSTNLLIKIDEQRR